MSQWRSFIQAARKAGTIPMGHFRVVVLESDLRTTIHDFSSRKQACSYATDAASETDDTPPIAIVLNDRFNVIFEGRPYYVQDE